MFNTNNFTGRIIQQNDKYIIINMYRPFEEFEICIGQAIIKICEDKLKYKHVLFRERLTFYNNYTNAEENYNREIRAGLKEFCDMFWEFNK